MSTLVFECVYKTVVFCLFLLRCGWASDFFWISETHQCTSSDVITHAVFGFRAEPLWQRVSSTVNRESSRLMEGMTRIGRCWGPTGEGIPVWEDSVSEAAVGAPNGPVYLANGASWLALSARPTQCRRGCWENKRGSKNNLKIVLFSIST